MKVLEMFGVNWWISLFILKMNVESFFEVKCLFDLGL